MPEVEDEQQIIKCQIGNACEVFCVEQNKGSGVEPNVLNVKNLIFLLTVTV